VSQRVVHSYILTIALLLISFNSYSDAYSDCILKNMKNISGDVAANAIKDACAKKNTQKIDSSEHIEQDAALMEVPSEAIEPEIKK